MEGLEGDTAARMYNNNKEDFTMKRIAVLALALCLTLACFQGAVAEENYEVMSFTMFNYSFSDTCLGTPVMDQYIARMEAFANAELGATLDITWEEMNLWDWLGTSSVWLASGDFPDVFTVWNKEDAISLGDEDMVADLTGYVDQMVYFGEYIKADPANFEACKSAETGNLYYFPFVQQNNSSATISNYYLRLDALRDNGITPPESMEEIYEVCKQYKELYPESYPFASGSMIDTILNWMRTANNIYWDGEKYVFGPLGAEERVKDAIGWLAMLYSEGLIDPEYEIETSEQFRTKMLNGTYFFTAQNYADQVMPINANEIYDVEWGTMKQPLNLYGEVSYQPAANPIGWSISPSGNGLVLINADTKVDFEKLVRLIDYSRYSQEMIDLAMWGILDETYVINEDGSKVYADKIMNSGDVQAELAVYGLGNSIRSGIQIMPQLSECNSASMGYIPCYDGGEYFYDTIYEFSDRVNGQNAVNPNHIAPSPTFTADELDYISSITTPVSTYVTENLTKFVAGELNLESDWEAFISGIPAMGDINAVVELYNPKIG